MASSPFTSFAPMTPFLLFFPIAKQLTGTATLVDFLPVVVPQSLHHDQTCSRVGYLNRDASLPHKKGKKIFIWVPAFVHQSNQHQSTLPWTQNKYLDRLDQNTVMTENLSNHHHRITFNILGILDPLLHEGNSDNEKLQIQNRTTAFFAKDEKKREENYGSWNLQSITKVSIIFAF